MDIKLYRSTIMSMDSFSKSLYLSLVLPLFSINRPIPDLRIAPRQLKRPYNITGSLYLFLFCMSLFNKVIAAFIRVLDPLNNKIFLLHSSDNMCP